MSEEKTLDELERELLELVLYGGRDQLTEQTMLRRQVLMRRFDAKYPNWREEGRRLFKDFDQAREAYFKFVQESPFDCGYGYDELQRILEGDEG